jgi:Flp pilus assembly protein TadD
LLLGKLEERRQGDEAAIGLYRRVVELDPEHDEARLRLTTQLVANRRGDEALPHAQALRERLPENPEVALLWAKVLSLLGRTAESRSVLDQCLQSHPDFADAVLERGNIALIDGDEVAAEGYFARAVELAPGNLAACERYAFALARNGKAAEAGRVRAQAERLKADLDRITVLISGSLQERPNDPQVYHEIAQIALRAGLVRDALRWFHSALQVDPNHAPTHRALAAVYRQLDKPALAARHRALAQQFGEAPPKP